LWSNTDLLEEGGINHRRDHYHDSNHRFRGGIGSDHFCLRLLHHLLPLFKIIQDNLQVLKERGEQDVQTAINEGYDSMFDAGVGLLVVIPSRKSCQQMKDNPDCF
jgi:hypothetical protein